MEDKMGDDKEFVSHIRQKFRLALAINIIQNKPKHQTIDEYIEILRKNVNKNETIDLDDITMVSDDFLLDDDDENNNVDVVGDEIVNTSHDMDMINIGVNSKINAIENNQKDCTEEELCNTYRNMTQSPNILANFDDQQVFGDNNEKRNEELVIIDEEVDNLGFIEKPTTYETDITKDDHKTAKAKNIIIQETQVMDLDSDDNDITDCEMDVLFDDNFSQNMNSINNTQTTFCDVLTQVDTDDAIAANNNNIKANDIVINDNIILYSSVTIDARNVKDDKSVKLHKKVKSLKANESKCDKNIVYNKKVTKAINKMNSNVDNKRNIAKKLVNFTNNIEDSQQTEIYTIPGMTQPMSCISQSQEVKTYNIEKKHLTKVNRDANKHKNSVLEENFNFYKQDMEHNNKDMDIKVNKIAKINTNDKTIRPNSEVLIDKDFNTKNVNDFGSIGNVNKEKTKVIQHFPNQTCQPIDLTKNNEKFIDLRCDESFSGVSDTIYNNNFDNYTSTNERNINAYNKDTTTVVVANKDYATSTKNKEIATAAFDNELIPITTKDNDSRNDIVTNEDRVKNNANSEQINNIAFDVNENEQNMNTHKRKFDQKDLVHNQSILPNNIIEISNILSSNNKIVETQIHNTAAIETFEDINLITNLNTNKKTENIQNEDLKLKHTDQHIHNPSQAIYHTEFNNNITNISDKNTEDSAIIPFKIIEEINRIKSYLNRGDRRNSTDGCSVDSGYRSDSQVRGSLKIATQSSLTWLNQSAHSLLDYVLTCPLLTTTLEITEEISMVLSDLIEKLHSEEIYPPFLDLILENINILLEEITKGDDELMNIQIEEKIHRFLHLNKSINIIKYTLEKITAKLEYIYENLSKTAPYYEITNVNETQYINYIFHILEILLKRYLKQKDIYSSQLSQQSEIKIKKTSISDIWRSKWNGKSLKKELPSKEFELKDVTIKMADVLNKIIINCMEGYSLVSFAALQCFNILQC